MEGKPMIARYWRGWTKPECADEYENLLKTKVLPGLGAIEGYRGGYILRSENVTETEFVVLNLFDTLEAVKQFAGLEYTVPVFEPEAKALLSRREDSATHYEVRACTVSGVAVEGIRARVPGLKLGELDWVELKREGDEGRP
jgi:heme-degrading monooxygenase HmoA